ncbi:MULTISPECIES: type III secretion apparatus protein OrgA/MxiK [Burkholderia]|uniref:type III secretion apparatus protein OrgA/MxiK n=1 Tax=Burkholderia TaxID=32008 RepID=UPI0007571C67|nr:MULTISPECIES: type III secretion apparatus protein OrgA/MxiK [Burkholderia]AOJ73549.1 type III secretion system protein [Burkholderia savannae]KVG38908.1 type III secretion system protein [Burkholderia sp. MSMB0265]KVG81634.1 type III secretion system protein [Burkholderia sp. MSMB2040]KVG98791.1 type III secretion system protein [Burkholderia sp. MSMB2042]KVG98972.1 type III secretion system protein [Burkholderia sp. MSMB2041]
MNPHALVNVMYGPFGYAHPEYRTIAGVDLTNLPADIANQLMIDRLRLDTKIDFDLGEAPVARQCVNHWTHLPRVCFLIGVQRLRTALVEHCRYMHLDPTSQRFLCLPLHAVPKVECADSPDDDTIVAAGSACLAGELQHAPRALRQRLPLLFPRAYAKRLEIHLDGAHDVRAAWHATLFSFALNYALLDTATAS